MKGFAYAVFLSIVAGILLQPFLEVLAVFVDKAKIDSALENSGKIAIQYSVDANRKDVQTQIDFNTFKRNFGENFAKVLKLKEPISYAGNTLVFSGDGDLEEDAYHDFTLKFVYHEEIDPNAPSNDPYNGQRIYYSVQASTEYKYKTKYLKEFASNFDGFDLTRDRNFYIRIQN